MYRPKMSAGQVKPRLYNRLAAAKLLGDVHVRTVDRLVQRGKLRSVKLGTRSMIFADSVDELLASGE